MIYWVIVATSEGRVVRRRPHSSSPMAEEYADAIRDQFPGHSLEVRPAPNGEFPRAATIHSLSVD
jgi:hypothetical protein